MPPVALVHMSVQLRKAAGSYDPPNLPSGALFVD